MPQAEWLKQPTFLTVVEAERFKIKVPADSVPGEDALAEAAFLLGPHMMEAEGFGLASSS